MKRFYLLILFIFIFLYCGCSTNKLENNLNKSLESTISTSNISKKQSEMTTTCDAFKIYGIYSKKPDDFDRIIAENEIDKNYKTDIDKATTTQEMVEVEKKYIEQWKNEMQNIIAKIETILIKNDYNDFKEAQDEWEKQMLNNVKVDNNIITNDQYNIFIGSAYRWTYLSYIRQQYRERVYHIKYLIYLLQNAENN
ncbi:MAG TPA: hypothetical protein DEB10_08140 [Ruminococcaceae bacterium]|nr:hypothetical protein [Oscillospiraceae bacterium]